MQSLSEFLLEVVGSKELAQSIEFIETGPNSIDRILDNKGGIGKFLGTEYETVYMCWPSYVGATRHFKIFYKDRCIGVIGLAWGKDMFKKLSGYSSTREMLMFIAYPHLKKEIDSIGDGPTTMNFRYDLNKFINNVLYVSYLILFKDSYKDLDLSPIAAIKVVFDEIKDTAKQDGIKIIIVAGKDDRTTDLYCRLAGFQRIADNYPVDLEDYSRCQHFKDSIKEAGDDPKNSYDEWKNHTVELYV